MHGDAAFLANWAKDFEAPRDGVKVLVCPSAPYLSAARALLPETVFLGAQNVARWPEDGAYTGEISAPMLVDCGCSHVLVGHSERRILAPRERCRLCRQTFRRSRFGLCPILCVGESADARAAGDIEAVVRAQLQKGLQGATPAVFSALTIAYEPLWAIGTALTPTMEQIGTMHRFIRSTLISQTTAFGDKITILYGGSVHERNVADILSCSETGGVLVGGASLKAQSFADICRLAAA